MSAVVAKLPENFIRDSLECGCDVGDYDRNAGTLTATSDQLNELIVRVDWYLDPWGPDDIGDGGTLKRSAISLRKALKREGLL